MLEKTFLLFPTKRLSNLPRLRYLNDLGTIAPSMGQIYLHPEQTNILPTTVNSQSILLRSCLKRFNKKSSLKSASFYGIIFSL